MFALQILICLNLNGPCERPQWLDGGFGGRTQAQCWVEADRRTLALLRRGWPVHVVICGPVTA